MMQQYMQIKKRYPDCLLLFRLGDFYELFLEDAHIGAKVLQITLTARPRGKDGKIPMAGVPYHAVDRYIGKLVEEGYKVAICEQVSEADSKGIVDREVVRVVTPGTQLDERALPEKANNNIVSLAFGNKEVGIALADVSTGSFKATQISLNGEGLLAEELSRISPSECLVDASISKEQLSFLEKAVDTHISKYDDFISDTRKAKSLIKDFFKVESLAGYGIENKNLAMYASASLLKYVEYTQKRKPGHIKRIQKYTLGEYMEIGESSIKNLELFLSLRDSENRGTLQYVIDHTCSSMGGRMLAEWMRRPLQKKKEIEVRHDIVESFHNDTHLRKKVRALVNEMYDVERLVAKLSTGIGNPSDLINLKVSLERAIDVKNLLKKSQKKELDTVARGIDKKINSVMDIIGNRIMDEPPIDPKKGGLVKEGFHCKLDEMRKKVSGGKNWLAELEETEKKRTGITTLKVRFNKVFGYYIEVSQSFKDKVPEEYIRKQTLVNAERYITPELKEYEEMILQTEDKVHDLEYELFVGCVDDVLGHLGAIQKAAQAVAQIDCLANFAHVAHQNDYVRPSFVRKNTINIVDGRHPVVEKLLEEKRFVPNNVTLDAAENQLHIITGPNMAGKSVYMRQIALIVLLAHIGSFVPARSAEMNIVDKIFVRSGASDVITSGLSTFMVEMVETAYILHHATKQSLVILDEIGRGTSTFDGVSIAWAVAEYLVTNESVRPRTLFATHYHELQELEEKYNESIKNYHMAVEEYKGDLIFLHHVVPGGASHSYGIAVAKLAGVPKSVTKRAQEKLQLLEQTHTEHEKD